MWTVDPTDPSISWMLCETARSSSTPKCAWGRPLPRPAELSGGKGEGSIKLGITAHSASHPRNGSESKLAYPVVVPTARVLTPGGHDPASDQANKCARPGTPVPQQQSGS